MVARTLFIILSLLAAACSKKSSEAEVPKLVRAMLEAEKELKAQGCEYRDGAGQFACISKLNFKGQLEAIVHLEQKTAELYAAKLPEIDPVKLRKKLNAIWYKRVLLEKTSDRRQAGQ